MTPRLIAIICYPSVCESNQVIEVYHAVSIKIADRDAGKPWTQKLPFPVQVVSRATVKGLGLAWHHDFGERQGLEATA